MVKRIIIGTVLVVLLLVGAISITSCGKKSSSDKATATGSSAPATTGLVIIVGEGS